MKRTSWSKSLTAILRAQDSRSTKETLAAYDHLLAASELASRGSISDWDVAEVMFLRAYFLEQAGLHAKALAAYLKLGEWRRSHITGHGHALASALEAAVSAAVKAGQRRKALSLAQQVVRLRGEYPYASSGLREAVSLLESEQRRRSRRAEREQRRKGVLP
jgi:tetratricopeptide (TPR) repeat protein